jgi:Chaperone for flagella basal body P-ring formation
MPHTHRAAIALSLALYLAAPAAQSAPVRRVVVDGPRITLADLIPSHPELDRVDLGAAPPAGGTRLVTQKQIRRALEALADAGDPVSLAGAPIPKSVRVARRSVHLGLARQKQLVKQSVNLPKGVTIKRIRPRRSVQVGGGWTTVEFFVPRPPRRVGPWSTSLTARLMKDGVLVGSFGVTVDLTVSAEAAEPDLARGAPVTLIVRQGRVEVQVRGVADRDADVGAIFSVRLRPSGKIVRARLLTSDRAIALEAGR